MIELGQKVRDKITGFEGIAVARTEYINGCSRVNVAAPVDKDGKVPDWVDFDEPQLEVVGDAAIARVDDKAGGVKPTAPPRRTGARRA